MNIYEKLIITFFILGVTSFFAGWLTDTRMFGYDLHTKILYTIMTVSIVGLITSVIISVWFIW